MKIVLIVISLICLLLLTSFGKHIQAYFEVGFILFFLVLVSASIFWFLGGCRTSISDEISEKNRSRNETFSVILIIGVIALIIYINNR